MYFPIQCGDCKHCVPEIWGVGCCRTFPNGIPAEILKGARNHNLPFPGDNGILFEPEDEAAAQRWVLPEQMPKL